MSSAGVSMTQAPKLREVYRGATPRTIFITVPGVDTPPLQNWSNGDGGIWLSSIPPTSAPDIAVYCFEHDLRADDELLWTTLFDKGAELLDELIRLGEIEELSRCPICFISHSLGGIIVKEAMGLIHQQASDFRPLRRSIAGAIFLGTPHSQSEDPKLWENAGAILRLHAKSKHSKLQVGRETAKRLAKVSRSFEQAFDLIPVLSAFELNATRIGGYLSSRIVLVGKDFAKTNVRLETVVGIEADHNKICCLQIGSPALNEISSFLKSAVNSAVARISNGSDEYMPPAALDAQTIQMPSPTWSHNQLEGDQPLSEQSTNITTLGSTSMGFDIIPLVSDFSPERGDPRLPCHIMPPHSRNRAFFGRSEILQSIRATLWPKQEDEVLSDSDPNLSMFALCGPGGIGKTQVATEFVHTAKNRYDAIFWLQADQHSKLSQGYTNIAIKLGLVIEDSADARDPVVVQEVVKGWLSNPVKTYMQQDSKPKLATWLIIFDNVDDPDILDDFWPSDYSGAGAVLITSRDPLARTYIYSENSGITLPPFTTNEATEFLLKLTKREAEESERVSGCSVAARLGGLPLALTQMAGVIDRKALSFAEFLRVFEEEDVRSKLFKTQLGSSKVRMGGYEHTLDTVWALEKLSKSSSILLDVLSLLDPDGIPETILQCTSPGLHAAAYPQTEAAYQEARAELLQSSLIARDRAANRITIHRLVQDGARSKMLPQRFAVVFELVVEILHSAWPFEHFSFGHGVSRWAKCTELFPHVTQLLRFTSQLKSPEVVTQTSLKHPRLLDDAGRFNHQRGNSLDSTAYFEAAESICKSLEHVLEKTESKSVEILKAVKILSGEINHDLGCIATETNQPAAALTNFQAFNRLMIEFSGGKPQSNDMGLAVSWNELGNAHMMNQEWTLGEECFLRSMEALKQLDDYKPVDSSFPVINLGFSYWLQGRLEEAEKTLCDILAIRESVYGINDRESFMTGKLLHAYGNVKASQGKWDESFKLHVRSLQQYKSTIGNHHHRTGDLCVKVSDHYVRLSQYDIAISLLDQALKIFGDREYYNPEKARALYKKAKILKLFKNQSSDNETYMNDALDLYRKLSKGSVRPDRGIYEPTDEDFDGLIVFWSR